MRGVMSANLEEQRAALQTKLESEKTKDERNRLGQFATPFDLAVDILKFAANLLPEDEDVSFLDPAVGTGVFYSALREVFPQRRIKDADGFEIDPHFEKPASQLWQAAGLNIKLADFTRAEPTRKYNLIICNPPYSRHHHLSGDEKSRLQYQTNQASNMRISGLAGLYGHFLGLSHIWMADGGVAGWLIPSEFMDVNYGKAIKHYLLNQVTLLYIHRFDPNDVQFADALVSSAVVWFRKSPPLSDQSVTFSFGGTLLKPLTARSIPAKVLAHESKWSRFPSADIRGRRNNSILSNFFQIKRGLVTGDNNYFILSAAQIESLDLPKELFRPILPSPRYLPNDEIVADCDGVPAITRQLFLLDTRLPEDEICNRYPGLYRYIQRGVTFRIHERYICRHRKPWYSQENRPSPPIICTYLGRGDGKDGKPFRFILNESDATVANVYLAMYPKPFLARAIERDSTLLRRIWQTLGELKPDELLGEGRVYGGGLYKLEPRELGNVDATKIAQLIPGYKERVAAKQLSLFNEAD